MESRNRNTQQRLLRLYWIFAIPLFFFASSALSADGDKEYESQGALPDHLEPTLSPPRSPEQALQSFQLDPQFVIELIAHEPLIEDPVAIDFHPDGALFVAEMTGFMQDMEATGQFDEIGRIARLTDSDGDGSMDSRTTWMGGLMLPRALRVYRDGLLVADHKQLWFTRDTDGDGVADVKDLIDDEYATSGSVEHRANGLLLGLDNWIYNAKSEKRYRFRDGEWAIEETEGRGQWGISQDDSGRLFYNFNWSQLHCDLAPPNWLSRNPHFTPTLASNAAVTRDQRVYPIRMNTAVNRGYRTGVLDGKGRLLEFASACSPWIYRGGAFPAEFHGNAFVCAPGANTVKRNLLSTSGFTVTASNGYPDRDFLASDDERFRPVALSDGPDGALYLVDMYRGIIQQAEFMTSYLKEDSKRRELVSPINLGRIYRIRPRETERATLPALATIEDCVAALHHPNGWWRDRAQQALVEQADESIAADLEEIVREDKSIAALHALWTLEGMNALRFDLLRNLLIDTRTEIATTAMLLLATHDKNSGEKSDAIASHIEEVGRTDPVRGFHAILALGEFDATTDAIASLASIYADNPLIREAIVSSLSKKELSFLSLISSSPEWTNATVGREALIEMVAIAGQRSAGHKESVSLVNAHSWVSTATERGSSTARLELAKNDPERESDMELNERERKAFAKGHSLYAGLCASCHGVGGQGLSPLAPPLIDSDWVTGDPDRFAKILLHGLEGPVEVAGKRYAPPEILPEMPPIGMMSDSEIAAVMTYVRHAWGHTAAPVSAKAVGRVRGLHYSRERAWTAAELNQDLADEGN